MLGFKFWQLQLSTHCSGSAAKTYFDLFLILIDY